MEIKIIYPELEQHLLLLLSCSQTRKKMHLSSKVLTLCRCVHGMLAVDQRSHTRDDACEFKDEDGDENHDNRESGVSRESEKRK